MSDERHQARTPGRKASRHGTKSARQWQDVQQAARIAKTDDVVVCLHGIKVYPRHMSEKDVSKGASGRGATSSAKRDTLARDAQKVQPMSESVNGSRAAESKNLNRHKKRMTEFIKKKVYAKWRKIVGKLNKMASDCRGWSIKGDFLSRRLEVRTRALGFLQRVFRVHRARSVCNDTGPSKDPEWGIHGEYVGSAAPAWRTLAMCISDADLDRIAPEESGPAPERSAPLSPNAPSFEPATPDAFANEFANEAPPPPPAGDQPSLLARVARKTPSPKPSPKVPKCRKVKK